MLKTQISALVLVCAAMVTACSTPNGMQGQAASRFQQFDTDGDGFISPAEAPSRIDFAAADANGDGRLSLSEVETYTANLRR